MWGHHFLALQIQTRIAVSVGLLDPKEGARVESWLDWWTGRVSFKEDAVSSSLIESLETGLKQWGEERAGKRSKS